MTILGINAFHGDSSAALLSGGVLVNAIEEERLNRQKHWAGLPVGAVNACLEDTTSNDVQHVAISRDPRANTGAKIARVLANPSSWARAASRVSNGICVARYGDDLKDKCPRLSPNTKIHFVEHHRAHMASGFFCSPFDEATVVSIDGFGDFSSFMWGTGRGNSLDVRGAVHYPHSLGLFYTAFTQFLGFMKYGDEYKMMGLAAYGEPRFAPQVRNVVRVSGTEFELDLDYFTHVSKGVAMTWDGGEPVLGSVYSDKMREVFGTPRVPRSEIEQVHADMAASVQLVLEECYFRLLNEIFNRTQLPALCLAGGVALNCAANGKIFERTPFRELYIQPAANDAGTSIGAALYVQHQVLGQSRSFVMNHAYYGPQHSNASIRSELDVEGVAYHALPANELISRTAEEIAAGKIVGWYQGRMEFGPRALGNRSILADPRRHDMKDTLNARIKYREPFRPFCPSILAEETDRFFETSYPSPFMVQAYKIRPDQQKNIPAVTHADGTGRLQTVERSANPLYWDLIRRFGDITGIPVLLNTSFNENEPIVNTPREALECFLRTQMDVLVAGPYLLLKSENIRHSETRHAFTATAASAPQQSV